VAGFAEHHLEFVEGLYASGGDFDMLGVASMLGRTFTPLDDHRDGGPDGPVALTSHPSGSSASAAGPM
jgi:hypothetical protein